MKKGNTDKGGITEYKIYKSPWKAIRLMLLCSIFVVPGIFFHSSSENQWIEWMCICFFSLGYLVGIYQLLDRRPQIIVNEIGIFDRTLHMDFINWGIIQDAYIASVQRQKFICLVVDEKFEPSRKKGSAYKFFADVSKEMGFQELNLAVGFTDINASKFLEFILAMRTAKQTDRKFLIESH